MYSTTMTVISVLTLSTNQITSIGRFYNYKPFFDLLFAHSEHYLIIYVLYASEVPMLSDKGNECDEQAATDMVLTQNKPFVLFDYQVCHFCLGIATSSRLHFHVPVSVCNAVELF